MLIAEFLFPCLDAGGGGSEDVTVSSTSLSSPVVSSSGRSATGIVTLSSNSGEAVGGSANVGGEG